MTHRYSLADWRKDHGVVRLADVLPPTDYAAVRMTAAVRRQVKRAGDRASIEDRLRSLEQRAKDGHR